MVESSGSAIAVKLVILGEGKFFSQIPRIGVFHTKSLVYSSCGQNLSPPEILSGCFRRQLRVDSER